MEIKVFDIRLSCNLGNHDKTEVNTDLIFFL